MLFQAIKDSFAKAADYQKHRLFLDMGVIAIEETGRRMVIKHSVLMKIFIFTLTFLAGPVFGTALAMGEIDLGDDAPFWTVGIAVLVPLVMTAMLFTMARRMILSPAHCELDASSRRIKLVNPPCDEHYPGKRWPTSIPLDSIHEMRVSRHNAGEGGEVFVFELFLNEEDFIKLLATQSKKKLERITTFMREKMDLEVTSEAPLP